MTNLVTAIAKTPLPKEFLEQIDMQQLIANFREDYDRLDELSQVRSRHQSRNAISRWWNKDELEDAQLDAAELQASFSKKLGQLMAISVAQAKELQLQQTHLVDQQRDIQQQTLMLEASDELILKQQQQLTGQQQKLDSQQGLLSEQARVISQQQQELARLVQEYFEIKGLTMDGAKKLIQIAQQVEATEAAMRNHVAQQVEQVQMALSSQQQDLNTQLQDLQAEVAEQVAQNHDSVSRAMAQGLDELSISLTAAFNTELQMQLQQQAQQLTTAINSSHEALVQSLADAIVATRDEFEQQLQSAKTALQQAQLAALNELSDKQVQQAEMHQTVEEKLAAMEAEFSQYRQHTGRHLARFKLGFVSMGVLLTAVIVCQAYLQFGL